MYGTTRSVPDVVWPRPSRRRDVWNSYRHTAVHRGFLARAALDGRQSATISAEIDSKRARRTRSMPICYSVAERIALKQCWRAINEAMRRGDNTAYARRKTGDLA